MWETIQQPIKHKTYIKETNWIYFIYSLLLSAFVGSACVTTRHMQVPTHTVLLAWPLTLQNTVYMHRPSQCPAAGILPPPRTTYVLLEPWVHTGAHKWPLVTSAASDAFWLNVLHVIRTPPHCTACPNLMCISSVNSHDSHNMYNSSLIN